MTTIKPRGCIAEVSDHCSAWDSCNLPRLLVHLVALLMMAACLDMHKHTRAAFVLRQALISSCSFMQAPLFTIKSKLFAKSTFVIGYDTAIRLIMPKYYGSEAKMLLELAAMRYRWAACVANVAAARLTAPSLLR